jgi:hypothetical protein
MDIFRRERRWKSNAFSKANERKRIREIYLLNIVTHDYIILDYYQFYYYELVARGMSAICDVEVITRLGV